MPSGHQYQTVRNLLTPRQMANLFLRLERSDEFLVEGGDNPPRLPCHVYVKGANVCVGYLGDDSAEIVDSHRRDTRARRRNLRRIFYSV
ncbi:MAG: hypothetical protein HYW25_01380 [Candidatus Aenigmarchaeota archaeon]|nr:hypothetical protein [Candidatus Aenigmarchaeota archaeon]